MSISKKIKTIDDKIKQNKAQYDLDKQTAQISVFICELSGCGFEPSCSHLNVSKYEFLTQKRLSRKSCCTEKI